MKIKLISGICILCGLICLYFIKPVPGGLYPPCPFRYLTGYYCPGCGSLRAMNSLLHGRIVEALDYNPLMVISIPFIAYLCISDLNMKVKGKGFLNRHLFSPLLYKIIMAMIIIFWIARNIKIYPFSILAP
jgi:hypothetical protein